MRIALSKNAAAGISVDRETADIGARSEMEGCSGRMGRLLLVREWVSPMNKDCKHPVTDFMPGDDGYTLEGGPQFLIKTNRACTH